MLKLTDNAIKMLISKYRAVLKKMRFKGAALFLSGCLLAPAPAMAAETVDFPGATLQYYDGYANCLAPSGTNTGKSASLSGNIVNVYNTRDQLGNVIGSFILGAVNLLDSDAVTDNKVFFYDGSGSNMNVHGGVAKNDSGSATAINNSVTVYDGTLSSSSNIVGGVAEVEDTNTSSTATAMDNSVTVSGGAVGNVSGGEAWNIAGTTAMATRNSVNINGTVSGIVVYGGRAIAYSDTATATGNSVTISGGRVDSIVYGGVAQSYSGTATATGNSVTISDGTVSSIVYGGVAQSDSGTATAAGNSVTISGGTIKNNVYGANAESSSGSAIAKNNTVTIKGSPTFENTTLYGGRANNGSGTSSGNTLNLHSAGLSVNGLYDFQNLNFYLPTTLEADGTMLYVTNEADISNAIVNVGIAGGSSPLKAGEGVTLINAGTLTGEPGNNKSNGQGMHGVTLRYEFEIERQSNQLFATVTSVGSNDQAKSLLEGKLAGALSVLQGQDMITDQAIPNAVQATSGQKTDTFAAVGYGNYRYETGSHIDSNGWSLAVGVAKERPGSNGGNLTHGFFFEGGRGSFGTFNSFANGDVRGSGNTNYYGVGALLRKNGKNGGKGYNYHEGSLRLGRVTTDFSAIISGVASGYDNGVPYYGAHYGFGRVANKNNGATLDIYGKLLYTHQGGSSLALTSGDQMDFSSSNSIRARVGTRYTAAPAKSGTTAYYGLAYEYEFDGKQNASSNGFDMESPSLKGGSLIGTIGLTHKQSTDSNFSLGLNLSGYAGKRQGVGVNAEFKWAF